MAGNKVSHAVPKNGPAEVVPPPRPPAPIVMGRSVNVHHKTKLHHVKINALDSTE